MNSLEKKLIGRIENAGFPEWELYDLDAKIDTGAYTSSLHCHHIEVGRDRKTVSFNILDPTHPEFEDRKFSSRISDIRTIKSSNGMAEERIVITTRILLAGSEYPIELSLTDRSEMKNPVLIGRKFLGKRRFIVDVTRTYTGKKKEKNHL